ncbi:MAG: glycosyltransferase [Patescibacteria group bacterium]
MRIRWHGMVGQLHSWSIVTQSLARAMDKIGGHEIFIKSTNSLKYFPDNLKHLLLPGYHSHLINEQGEFIDADFLDENRNIIITTSKNRFPEIQDRNFYDLELAYTILYQAPRRFYPQSRARAIIWNLDNSVFPPGWQEYHRALDYILPSSKFAHEIFKQNGIPKDKMLIIPHGVDTTIFNPDIPPFKLQTQKKIKIFCNTIQPHGRKLYDRVFKGYLDAFTSKDDVCLVLKTNFKKPNSKMAFEVDVKEILEKLYSQYKNPPEIEVINDTFIENIGSLYTACDIVVNMSSIECFWLPGLESLACGNIVIAPRYGGQLEYLNDDNSLLVDTKEMEAPASHQYWTYNTKALTGDPSIKHFTELLRYAYENLDKEKARIKMAAKETVEKFSWESAAQMILDLPIPEKSFRIKSKKKVLYVVPYEICGGGETWIKEVIKQLDKDIYEPYVACLNATPELKKMFVDVGAYVEDFTNNGQLWSLKCALEAENYAIIHFYNSFGVYEILKLAWTQGWRCRVVETVHSDLSWSDSMTKVATREKMVTMIVAVSQTMAQKLNKFGNRNVVVLPQPIDWNRFKIERSKEILKQYGIPDGFTVGFVGRLSPEKNIPVIFQCAKNMPDISFVFVGNGPQEMALRQIAAPLKNIFFVGKQTNVEKYYAAFDVLMLPSIMEGMPLVILEAMSVGTPVIASNVGAISEIIKDGVNGFLLNNYNDYLGYIASITKLRYEKLWNNFSINCKAIVGSFEEQAKNTDINKLYKLMF